jgi:O-antigen/teichoic acid export membrane protein
MKVQHETSASDASPEPAGIGTRASSFSDSGLFRALARSFSWAGFGRAVNTIGTMARYAVFARLLTPYDFGVTTMALLTLEMLSTFTNLNLELALVQQKEEIDPYLDTVWVVTIARGMLLAAILIICARAFAAFFRQEESYIVFWAVAPIALIRAAQSPASILLFRNLQFHVVLMLNAAELLLSTTAGITGIFLWNNWRGLIAAALVGQATRSLLSYYYFPYRPRIRFNRARFAKMFAYSRWVSGASIAAFAAQQLDNFVVAHLIGPKAVGDYQMAFRIGETPASELAYAASIVTFPMAAKLADDPRRCRRLFRWTVGGVAIVGVCYGFLMVRFGETIIRGILGEKWLGAMSGVRLLCFYGLFQGLLVLGRSFLDGLGAPASSFNTMALRALILSLLIYPFTSRLGMAGAAAAALISVVAPLPLMLFLYRRAEAAAGPEGQAALRSAR